MKQAECKSRAICILGMHRSGTSTVTRAINLLGVPLGEAAKMMPGTSANAEGYWEHLEIYDLQKRLLARLELGWNTVAPMPDQWVQSEIIHPFKDELAKLVASNFGSYALWGWKEPQTCLLLPLWREILEKADTKLSCLFVVRSPVDVANSLTRRDAIPFDKAVGLWFHHNIAALKDAAGLPIVFSSYDRLLSAWEPELRRCAAALELDWPKDEQRHRETMNAFIKPGLRHNQSSLDQLRALPYPVQELYEVLLHASNQPSLYDNRFEATINRLSKEFHAYASFFPNTQPPTHANPFDATVNRLSNDLEAYLSYLPKDTGARLRGLVLAWRADVGVKFQCLRIQSKSRPPKFVQRLLGEKLCRSMCKRLAEAGCWIYP